MSAVARLTLHGGRPTTDSVITILFDGQPINEARLGTRFCEIATLIGNPGLAAIMNDFGTGRRRIGWGDLIHVFAYWSWLTEDVRDLPDDELRPWSGGDVFEIPLRLNV